MDTYNTALCYSIYFIFCFKYMSMVVSHIDIYTLYIYEKCKVTLKMFFIQNIPKKPTTIKSVLT